MNYISFDKLLDKLYIYKQKIQLKQSLYCEKANVNKKLSLRIALI